MTSDERRRLAEAVRLACIEAARQGFLDADLSGLCREGAIEAAVSAMQMADLEHLPVSQE